MESVLKLTETGVLDHFWQTLNLPRSCYLGNRITKKALLANESLTAGDKKLLVDDIESLYWEYTLKPETINISPLQTDALDYGEIAVLKCVLRHSKRTKRLAEVLQRLIPYPMVLVLHDQHQFRINLALKRQNLANQQKLTLISFIDTDWLLVTAQEDCLKPFYRSLNSQQFNWGNFYVFYLSLIERVLAFQRASITGQFQWGIQTPSADHLLLQQKMIAEYFHLQNEVAICRKQAAKARQLNKRVALNTRIHQLKQTISALKQRL